MNTIVPAIQLNDFSFTYANSTESALRDINLSIQANHFTMIMGRTGSGKTSLVRTLNQIIPKFFKGKISGTVKLHGKQVENRTVTSFAGQIGMIFQDFESQLFSTNIQMDLAFGPENIGTPPEIIKHRMAEILKTFNLESLASRDPATLSGGQKQRLAIATILMMDPEILILDEPATDLDPESREKVYSIISHLVNKNRTVILIDHSPDYAQAAHSIIMMEKGSAVKHGPSSAILSDFPLLNRCGIRLPHISNVLRRMNIASETCDPAIAAELILSRYARPDSQDFPPSVSTVDADLQNDPVIETENVHFSYGNTPVLNGIDLTIRCGEFIAFIGRNGSGKTTLAKHFNGLLTPTSGVVKFKGRAVEKYSSREFAHLAGYVFQNPDHQIFRPTVYEEIAFGPENIGMTPEEIKSAVKIAMNTTGIAGRESDDPFMLTKGDRQRVAVASILAMKPDVIILDEPTTGLDYPDQLRMMELLQRLNQSGHTIIIITHSMTLTLEFARRAVVMADGKIIADGPVQSIFADRLTLDAASLKAPPLVELSRQFGFTARTIHEFTHPWESQFNKTAP